MLAYIKDFTYPDSKTGLPKNRKLYVLNEDASRVAGIDLETVNEEELLHLKKMFKEHEISDFTRKPKDSNAPKVDAPRIGVYKAFSKAKIISVVTHEE